MRRLYGCELADILYVAPLRWGGVNLFTIWSFTILSFISGAKVRRIFELYKFFFIILFANSPFYAKVYATASRRQSDHQ